MKSIFSLFSRKNKSEADCGFDRDKETPVIRASICTGEKAAGFRDRKTGAFREVMLIRSQKDLDAFMKKFGLDEIDTEY